MAKIPLDPPKTAKGKRLYRMLVDSQKAWIAYCESNGKSYSGPNGQSIKQADLDELKNLENRLNNFK